MKQQISLLLIVVALLCKSQTTNFAKAPNSYVFDLGLANSKNYAGLEIPVKKAYEMWATYKYLQINGKATPIPSGNLSASLYWEDVPGIVQAVSIMPGSSPEDSLIKVDINKNKGKGNAVIAFKVDNIIYWSWHIWITDNPENGVKYSQGFETDINGNLIEIEYMDRNLGASTASFLDNNWQKSGGLLYEWGRKDPFPALVNKDFSFYGIDGEVGNLKHRLIGGANTIPIKVREYDEIEKNMGFAVKNPLTLIINADNANWFSNKLHKTDGPNSEFTAWDLWSDNTRGGNSNANSSNAALRKDSRSYELKSELDPCPDGWRVPSYYGRTTQNNNLGPWGRKSSGVNDDNSDNSLLQADQENPVLSGIKVYPGLGMDFTNAQNGNRNLGIMPIPGNYIAYPNSVAPNTENYSIFQDQNASGGLWSGSYGYDGARFLGLISDAHRLDVSFSGLNAVYVNQTGRTKDALAVRCMRDPNVDFIGHFPTQYITDVKENFTTGLQNPNTYLLVNKNTVEIPISKAFSVYNQILTDRENLATNHLVAKILWTDNPNLVSKINLDLSGNDVRNGKIKINLNSGQYGNAVVSLHNNSTDTPAYWSWQIWSVAEDPTANTITYTTENGLPATYNLVNVTESSLLPLTTTFMDRNLGSITEVNNYPVGNLQETAANAKGLQYQWGRKDPIPSFAVKQVGKSTNTIYLGAENTSETGILTYTEINDLDYKNNYSKDFSQFASNNSSDIKKITENILYSVKNPLLYLYQNGTGQLYDGGNKSNNDLTKIRDWVASEKGKAADRWGHADEKSIYDPCPSGWRVPDVSFTTLYTSSKGNSPWYNGYQNDQYGKNGLIQDQDTDISNYYGGENMSGYYVVFRNGNYKIGGFPYAGMRGELGGNDLSSERSGVWTAAMADLDTGYALAMEFDQYNLQTATGAYPQAAMSVRCAKDEPRFFVNSTSTGYEKGDVLGNSEVNPQKDVLEIYPNPFKNKIFFKKELPNTFEIYDMSGKIIKKGNIKNKEIDAADLLSGIYILKITQKDGQIITRKMIKGKH